MTERELKEEDVAALAQAGGAAPSGGNAQAWRLLVRGPLLELYVDPERAGGFIDVDGCASLLGLGAFAENVLLEARARGLELRPELTGADGLEQPAVRLVLVGRGEPGEPPALRAAIPERATNRKPFDGHVVDADAIGSLREATRAAGDGYDLAATADEQDKRELARSLAEADVIRTFNPSYHAQMMSEMRWTPQEAQRTADGVDVATLELPEGDLKGLRMMRSRLFVRLLVTRSRIRSMTERALAQSSHLCCVTMPREPTPATLVGAGRALQRAWLAVTESGLWAQPWSVAPLFALRAERHPDTLRPKEVTALRELDARLSDLWQIPKDRRAIFLFRLFRGEPPSVRAARRPWRSFTRIEEGTGADPDRGAGGEPSPG